MQTDTLQRTDVKQSVTQDPQPAPTPPSASIAATAPGQLRVIKRNGTVVSYDDSKIAVAMTKAFLAVEGGTAAASSRVQRTGPRSRRPDERDVRTTLPVGRHAAHRGHSGPGRTRADALRRAQSRPRLRAVPRQPRPRPRRAQAGCEADPDEPHDHPRRRQPRTARRRAPAHRRERSVRRPQRRRRRADHRRSTEQHVRRHLRERCRHVGVDHRANAGRGRTELHVRHRAHPARRSARRSARDSSAFRRAVQRQATSAPRNRRCARSIRSR